MALTFDPWPFKPTRPDDEARWWQECHVEHGLAARLQEQPYWSALFGPPSSGKSTVLRDVRRDLAGTALLIDYPPPKWPDPASGAAGSHLDRIMRLAAEKVRDWAEETPAYLAELSESQKGFFRWLLDKFIDPRAYIRLVDKLRARKLIDADQDQKLRQIAYEDIYPSQGIEEDVGGQIEDLITLCLNFNRQNVMVLVDIDGMLDASRLVQLEALFQWQELKHHLGFQGIIALSAMDRPAADWKELGGDRIEYFPLAAAEEQSLEIANRHVRLATQGAVEQVTDLLTAGQLEQVRGVLQTEYGCQPAGAWVKLAYMLLEQAASQGYPLPPAGFHALLRSFYCQNLKLYINRSAREPGVWRGGRFIRLEPAPFQLVCELAKQKGQPVFHYDMHQKKVNMHTLVHRLREQIEPPLVEANQDEAASPGQSPIYLQNRKSYGYWLENFVDLSGLEGDL